MGLAFSQLRCFSLLSSMFASFLGVHQGVVVEYHLHLMGVVFA